MNATKENKKKREQKEKQISLNSILRQIMVGAPEEVQMAAVVVMDYLESVSVDAEQEDGMTAEEEETEKAPFSRSSKMDKRKDGKIDFDLYFGFSKFDGEQGLLAGIVYEPDVVDAQGDSANEQEITMAAHDFMMNSMKIGEMHEKDISDKVKIVESYVAPAVFSLGNQQVRKGTWVMVVKILDEQLRKDIKTGKFTGFSMSGTAVNSAS